jgi:hypothetical protein
MANQNKAMELFLAHSKIMNPKNPIKTIPEEIE